MDDPDRAAPEEIMWQGRFVTAKRRGKWEYVSRSRGIRAAVIIALVDGDVLLVEQYRVPLGRMSLELPAGLVGDGDDAAEEPLAAAGRELLEETGYEAARLEDCGDFWSSPGMVSESFKLVRAHGCVQRHAGGGVEGEDIAVHRVPLDGLPAFVSARRAAGSAIDVRLLMLLGVPGGTG